MSTNPEPRVLHGETRNERSVVSYARRHLLCERFCAACGWSRVIGTAGMLAWKRTHDAHDPDFRAPGPAWCRSPLLLRGWTRSLPQPSPPAEIDQTPRPWYRDFQRWLSGVSRPGRTANRLRLRRTRTGG